MSRLAARFLVQAPGQPLILRVMSDVLRALILRKSRQDLGKLDPHLLRDIGLTAAQAHDEATRPLWDAPKSWRQRD